MKGGAENRKKTITAGALGAVALLCVGYAYFELFGGSSAPPPQPHPQTVAATPSRGTTTTSKSTSSNPRGSSSTAAAAGVPAAKLASSAAGLDPTLDEVAMLRTESLAYSGSGRNIFSLNSVVELPTDVPAARPVKAVKLPPAPPPGPPPPPPTCPPTCPPINLKFFGTQKDEDGSMHAFFLGGDDVYFANQGEIVARKYKIVSIGTNSAQVEDLQNKNTQSLPLQH
ncbi:MAG: hypothetical protein PW792_12675 [Acidobacteriaceae bacterium]|nr:hypothetical protein [Acidobacteriaceae bacterium]